MHIHNKSVHGRKTFFVSLRIDDDDDDQEMTSDKTEKENRQGLPPGLMPKIKIGGVSSMKNLSGQNVHSNDDKSDGADQENGNGDSEEEEQQVEGPAENVLQRAAASKLTRIFSNQRVFRNPRDLPRGLWA